MSIWYHTKYFDMSYMNIKSSLYQILFQVYVKLLPHVNYIKQLQYVDLEPHFQLTH